MPAIATQRQRQLLGALVERRSTSRRVAVGERAGRIAPLVDQLDDADDLARRRQHRHGQHRARAVAGLVVEAAVVAASVLRLRRAPRSLVEVGDVDRLLVEDRLADDRLVVDVQLELLEVDLDRIVLRQHEVEQLLRRRLVLGLAAALLLDARRRCPRRRRSPGGTSRRMTASSFLMSRSDAARARSRPAPPARSWPVGRLPAPPALTWRDYTRSQSLR